MVRLRWGNALPKVPLAPVHPLRSVLCPLLGRAALSTWLGQGSQKPCGSWIFKAAGSSLALGRWPRGQGKTGQRWNPRETLGNYQMGLGFLLCHTSVRIDVCLRDAGDSTGAGVNDPPPIPLQQASAAQLPAPSSKMQSDFHHPSLLLPL